MTSSLVSLASLVDGFQPFAPEILVSGLVHHGGRLLLLQRQDQGRSSWCLPIVTLQPRETLEAALRRALRVGIRLDARMGTLLIVSELLAPGRHMVNLIFHARVGGASRLPLTALEPYVGFDWVQPARLRELSMPTPLAQALIEVAAEDFSGPVKILGDTYVAPPIIRPRRRRGMDSRRSGPPTF